MRRSLLAVAALLLVAFALVAADPQTISATRRAPRTDVSVANPDVFLDLRLSAAPVNRTVFRVVCRVDNNGIPLSSLIGGPGVTAAVANNAIVPVAADITLAVGATLATVTFRPSTTGAESPLCVFTFVSGDAAFTGAIDTVLVKVDPPVLGLTGFDTTDGLTLDVGYLPTLTLHTLSVTVATTFRVSCTGGRTTYFSGNVTVPINNNFVSFTFSAGSETPLDGQSCVARWISGDQRLISSTLSYDFDFVEARVTRTYFGLFGYCDELLKAVSGDQHTVVLTSSSVVGVDTSVNATCVPVGCPGGCSVAGIDNIVFNGTFAAGSTNASLVLHTPYLPATPAVNYVCSFSVAAGSGDGRLNKPVSALHELNLLVELANIRAVKPALGAVGDVIIVNSLQSAIFTVSLTHVVVVPGLTLQTVCSVQTSTGATVNSGIITLAQFHEETFQSTFAFTGTINGTHSCVISYHSTALDGVSLNPLTDDVRFALASYNFTVEVVATSLTFSTDKASYQPNTQGVVSLTANEVFAVDTSVSISCPGAGVFAKNAFTFTAGSTQLVQNISFKASVIPGVHECVLVIGASTVQGDLRYSNVQIGGVLSITIVAPTLRVSYCDYGSLTAGSTQYLTLRASEIVLADLAAEFRCTFTPAASATPPATAQLTVEDERESNDDVPSAEAAITNPNVSPVLTSTAYWYIKAGTQMSLPQSSVLTGIQVPNGFFGLASCRAVIVSSPDQRFNSSVFMNGGVGPLPIPVEWNVTLPKYELISTGIEDLSYLPVGSTQTITLRVNDPSTNAPFVVPLGGQINVTAQCMVEDPTQTEAGNTVLGGVLDDFSTTLNFLILGGRSQADVSVTLPSQLTTGLPAFVRCFFAYGNPGLLAVGPVATGMGDALNAEYTSTSSRDANIEPLEFYLAPPTLVLSSNADAIQQSGSNFVVTVTIDDRIAAEQDVLITVECISGQLDHPRYDELLVPIALGATSGSYVNRITQLGPQVCKIQAPKLKAGDATTLVGTVRASSTGALVGPSRLQFAGPKKNPLDGSIAKVSFLAVSASLTVGAGLADKSLVAVGLPLNVSLTSSIPTERYSAQVFLLCGGQKINFTFPAGGARTATASFTPSNKTGTFSCVFETTSPKSIVSQDQPFIDIALDATTYTVFVPKVTVTGIVDGASLRAGSQTNLQLNTNALVVGAEPLRVAMTCTNVTNYAGQAFEFYVTAGQASATSTSPFIAPSLPVNNTVCTLAYVSGDVRFAAAINAVAPLHISVTSVWSTLTVSPSGVVHPGQELTFNVALSEAARTTTVFVFSCALNGATGQAPQKNIVVMADTTTDSETYTLPATAGAGVCIFSFVSGDLRFQRQAPQSYVFTSVALPTSSSSSSTGAAAGEESSSSSSGSDDGANGGSSSSSSSGPAGGGSTVVVGPSGSPDESISGGAAAAITIGVVIGAIIIGIGGYFAVTAIVAASATAAAAGGAAAAGAGGVAMAAVGSGAAAVSAAPAAAAAAAPAAVSQAAHVAIGIGGL